MHQMIKIKLEFKEPPQGKVPGKEGLGRGFSKIMLRRPLLPPGRVTREKI
jgi:hypothetical protein